MERSELRKQIFLTCKTNCTSNDVDIIKEMRNTISLSNFGVIEPELNIKQLQELLFLLRNSEKKCSNKQEFSVRGHAFEFAIYYHNYQSIREFDKNGVRKSPDNIKLNIQTLFKNEGYRSIPAKYKTALVSETANPKCNELLVESGFRSSVRNPKSFYYDKMTSKEASYLISRFGQILNNTKIHKPIGFEKQISNN